MKLILASASVRRAEILHDAGFSFTVLSSAVDETPYPGESTHDLVERLAVAKAELDAARRTFVETTHVHFAKLDPEEITRYLSTGEPHDKAGAYAIQGRAGRFIPRIEGCYFNVVGLPLARLQQALTDLGWSED